MQDLKLNNPDYAWLNKIPEAITKQAVKDLVKAYKKAYKDRKTHKPDPKTLISIYRSSRKRISQKNLSCYYSQPLSRKVFSSAFCLKIRGSNAPNTTEGSICVHFVAMNSGAVNSNSFFQRTDNIHKTDDTHIKITGIKNPVKCSALKGVDLPKHIQNPRISYDGKYWYLSYSFEAAESDIIEFDRERLGIDLGIKDLAIFSDGQHFGNINKTPEVRRLRKRIKHLQCKVSKKYESNVSYDDKGNKVYHKTNNIKKLEAQMKLIYRRISNIQTTYMYEVVKAVPTTSEAKAITTKTGNVFAVKKPIYLLLS